LFACQFFAQHPATVGHTTGFFLQAEALHQAITINIKCNFDFFHDLTHRSLLEFIFYSIHPKTSKTGLAKICPRAGALCT
jgi:hypothetical protein